MSQIIKNLASGPVPPSVAQSYVTDNGTAVPAANILDVFGKSSTENNIKGIITKGGVAGTGTANELDVSLTNRLQGSGNTVGAVTTTIATMNLGATPGNYAWEFYVSGYEPTAPSGTGYNIQSCIRTDGATATLVSISDETYVEDPALGASDVQITVSGNSVNVTAIGIAGLTIHWNVVANYVFIG